MSSAKLESVVLLVDDKKRDLNGAALIAHQLRLRGVQCHLEPLEAFRAALEYYRPGMMIFNHLNAGHLVAFSKRLTEMNVLTAVLLNEGIFYDPEDMRYMAGRHHSTASIDYYFCWNEPHKRALLAEGADKNSRAEVIGIPRFDFYFEPWSKLSGDPWPTRQGRPRVLFCTNFQLAKFKELPRKAADDLFKASSQYISLYKDYWGAVQAQWRAQRDSLTYLKALLDAGKFEIILRPHPREDSQFYSQWVEQLPPKFQRWISVQPSANIDALILGADIEISCETCMTALESWIAGKPTVELIFERHPILYREEQARANVHCSDPESLPPIVTRELAGVSPELQALRREFLAKWCASPDGHASERLSTLIVNALRAKKPARWERLTFSDYRRAMRLGLAKSLGFAYHFSPLLWLKRAVLGARHETKLAAYRKSIKPADVTAARKRLSVFD